MRAISLCLLVLLLAGPALAEDIPPSPIVKTSLALDAPQVKKDKPIWAAVSFTMPRNWHIYWQNPGDSGVATSLSWQLPDGVHAGNILWPAPSRLNTGGIINYGYSDQATLLVPLTPARDDIEGDITVKASWLVCHEICIPESAALHAALPQRDPQAGAMIDTAKRQLPRAFAGMASYEARDREVALTILTPSGWNSDQAEFFPAEDGVIDDDAAQSVSFRGSRLIITAPRGNAELPKTWHGVLRVGDDSFDIAATHGAPTPESAATPALLVILLFAFVGGLLLNLMPCVLPILSLKALALAKKAHASQRQARLQGLSYAAGVVGGFLLIALIMLALRATGAAFGWGFQLQQPEVVTGLFLLMMLIALNLFGWFELPVLFGNLARKPDEATMLGSFLTGALAVAVATPCTAPFMAPAIGATLGLARLPSLLVFAALGLGMASPFLLISLWPRLRALLPKPGPWMLRFRQFLAFPMLATAVWLLTVLMAINGIGGISVALGGAMALGFLIWLSSFSAAKRRLLVMMLAVCAAAIYLQPAHQATSKPIPPQQGEVFSQSRLDALRAQGRPVFVDVTAAWCITCKLNERLALRDSAVQAYFVEHRIVPMVADWTNGDAAITKFLASFGRNGIPLYVFYPPQGEPRLLPQLLTPALVLDRVRLHQD